MDMSASLYAILPKIVAPIDIALHFFESDLQRIEKAGAASGSYSDIEDYLEHLEAFYKSVEALKYSLFEQIDLDVERSIKIAKNVVAECDHDPKVINETIERSKEIEKTFVEYVMKGFDPQTERANRLLSIAKSFQKTETKSS